MTGCGAGAAPLPPHHGAEVHVDARSVNHRHFEARVRVPGDDLELLHLVERRLRERFARGRFDVVVRFEGPGAPEALVDVGRARAVHAALVAVRDAVAPGEPVPLALLAHVPDALARPRVRLDEATRSAVFEACGAAWDELAASRRAEGAAMAQSLGEQSTALARALERVRDELPRARAAQRERALARSRRLASEAAVAVDDRRLELEVALLAERADVSEELSRLESHRTTLDELLMAEGAVGRRLEFVLQEVLREASTLGAKCQDAALSREVVAMKLAVDRMRELAENIE